MSTPQERVVALAKSQVGYVPPVGKWNKYAEALDKTDLYNYAKNGYDWCDIFYDWCLVQEFGVEVAKAMTNQPSKGCGAGCDFSASYYRAMNQWSGDPSLGAQIFFGSRGDEYHTGMVVGYDSAHVYTVEGNTGYSSGYSGGAVLERSYSRGDSRITGYGVPRWSMVDGEEPATDASNTWEATGELEIDGYLGVQSVSAWQTALGTPVDGLVSSQPWYCCGNTPNLVSVERCYGAEGSYLVSAIQRVVGAEVDGLMGPQTVRCLQAWLNAHGFDCGEIDGVLGPMTARAVQRSLNAGAWSE